MEELATRPPAALSVLAEACPEGLYVARLRRGRAFRVDWPWDKQSAALAVQPAPPPLTTTFGVQVPIGAYGGLPWVATVSGFVVFAAMATGVEPDENDSVRFELAPAGPWREAGWSRAVEQRWFHTGPGRPWFLWYPDRG